MVNEISGVKKKAGVRVGLIVALVIGSVFAYATFIQNLAIVPTDDGKSWHIVWEGNLAEAAEASLGAGAGGILEIYFVNHSATYVAVNTTATIEGWCDANDLGYANADDFNVELAHSVAFDVVVRVRGNHTQCYRTDKFYDTDLRVRWTCADLSIGADTSMTGTVTYNSSSEDFLWMNFESKGGGSGFTLPKDATYDIESIKFEAYY